MELEFNRCPKLDNELKAWATVFPSIKKILEEDPLTFNGGEQACFEWKAEELAKLHEDVLSEDKKSSHIEYVFPEDQIIEVLNGYAGSSWVQDAPDKLKERREKRITQKIKEVREYEEKERAYVNNIVRDWKNYDVPKADQGEYYINNAGVFRNVEIIKEDGKPQFVKKEVCRTPFVICGLSESYSDEEVYLKVRYPKSNVMKEFWASQSSLLSRKELKTLFLSKGINCPENTLLLETMEYISRSIAEFGERYKTEFTTKQCGWNEDNTLFVIGDRCVTSKGVDPVLSVDSKKGFPELEKTGTLQGWVAGVSDMMNYDVVRFKCYDMMTAILNRPLGIESHITDHYGNTSVGKTFSAWMGLSMIGDAEGLTVGAKGSIKGILVTVRDFSDLPLLVDESSDAGDHLAELVYPLTSNKGRVTSTVTKERDGGEEYHTTILFTGERPIRDCLKNSGQQYRVNELDDTIPPLDTKTITKVTRAIRSNHGHVIEMYVQEVMKKIADGSLQDLYDDCFESLPKTDSNIEGRSRSIFAGIMTAGTILEDIFKKIKIPTKNPCEIVNKYFTKCVLEKPVELEYIRALREILDWAQSESGRFMRWDGETDTFTTSDKNKSYGFVDDDFIDIFGSEFSKKMKDGGFSPTKIKEDCYRQGISLSNDPKRPGTYRTSRKGYGSYACVRIIKSIAYETAGFNEQIPKTEFANDRDLQHKVRMIYDTIHFLAGIKGEADIGIMRQILTFPELDELLDIMVRSGKIFMNSQTAYKSVR